MRRSERLNDVCVTLSLGKLEARPPKRLNCGGPCVVSDRTTGVAGVSSVATEFTTGAVMRHSDHELFKRRKKEEDISVSCVCV